MRNLALAWVLVTIAACAGTSRPEYQINEVLVVNNSRAVLNDVRITVPSTGRSFTCGSVAPLGICGNRFGKRRYEYRPIRIEWRYGDRSRRSDEFVVPVPATFYTGVPLRAVLSVSPDGAIETYFEQDAPTR